MLSKKNNLFLYTCILLLFSIWVFCIHLNWNLFQELRQSDSLWLVNAVYPWLYLILLSYLLLFVLNYDRFDQDVLNISFLSVLTLIIYGTPYIISNYYRFPDTFYVIQHSLNISDILVQNGGPIYPKSYPLAYTLFHIISNLSNIDLFLFSRLIWSPFILISSIIIWYLILKRIFNSRIAMISVMLVIPTQIIEITTTPNSLGLFFISTSLLLCTFKGTNFRVLFLISLIACLLSHVISFIVLFVSLSIFYLVTVLNSKSFNISLNTLFIGLVMWFAWTVLIVSMGQGIVSAIYNILTMESQSVEQLSTYTIYSGELTFPWIQKFNSYKYVLYAILTSVIFTWDIHLIIKQKISVIRNQLFLNRLAFLSISLVLLSITVVNLTFGGTNMENIISRTLNYSMLAISTYIGSSTIFISNTFSFSRNRTLALLFFFILIVSVTYPTYSYARDSYINYPISERYGDSFFSSHELEHISKHSKTSEFFMEMRTRNKEINPVVMDKENKIYNNGWYSVIQEKVV